MNTILSAFQGLANGAIPFFILLGILIFVHELGHFLVAKWCGVRVETFSLGFGKKILQYKRGDTTYCISLIPLGGYVKMFGDDPTKDIPGEDRKYSFLHKSVSQRIAIVLAGPLMNLFFAFFVFILIGLVGEPLPGNFLGDIAPGSRAYEAGFRSGDKVLSINGQPMNSWLDVKGKIAKSTNEKLHFLVEREDSIERAEVYATPVLGENDNILSSQSQVGTIEGLDALSYAAMIGIMSPESVAAQSGLKTMDVILKVNDREVYTWRDIERYIAEDIFKGRVPVQLEVLSYMEDKAQPRQVTLRYTAPKVEMESHGQASHQVNSVVSLNELGIEPAQLYLWKVKPGSPADKAGLKPGDRILAVGGEPLTSWDQVVGLIKNFNPDGPAPVFKYRRGSEESEVTIIPELTELMDSKGKEERRFTVGIVSGMVQANPRPVIQKVSGVGNLLKSGVSRTIETCGMVVMSIVRLVEGEVSAKNIGGIISIGRFATQSYEAGLVQFLKMMALISVNLFLLNLLPVPVLDGGHLVFYSIEALRGAPLSMRKMEIAQQVGLVLLMSLMAFALFNDISNWLNSLW